MTLELLKNHPLRYAAEEFSLADHAYRKMAETGIGDFTLYEKAWKEFLHRIERVWMKTQAAVHNMPNWKKIESEVARLRKKDPLLCYLQQARNVEEHSISDLAKDWEPKFEVTKKGNRIEFNWQEWDRPLLPVKNRGVIYNPPNSHMGKNIEHLKHKGKAEPRVIAELALIFYCDFLNRVTVEVVGSKRDF